MNRLWVRFSLVVAATSILIVLSPLLLRLTPFRLFRPPSEQLRGVLPEIMESLPPETVQQVREAAAAEALVGLLALVVVGALAALLVGVWLSRSLTAPLRRLETAARAIQSRDFSPRVPVGGSQELVEVATAFNDMAEQLQQAESLRRNLLADVAHELRHPLHVLQGNLQAILDDVYPLSQEEIGRLADQTRHLTALVNDLHELALAEARALPLHRQETDVATLVKEVAATFKPLAAGKGVQVQVELLGAIPTVVVDGARLRQVAHNLLDNALQHTAAGGRINVQMQQQEGELVVAVADTGAGIAPEHLEHVFDRFYRTDSGRSREHGGAGLGLAIVKAIVEAHGGRVAVASAGLGEGSRFEVRLPFV